MAPTQAVKVKHLARRLPYDLTGRPLAMAPGSWPGWLFGGAYPLFHPWIDLFPSTRPRGDRVLGDLPCAAVVSAWDRPVLDPWTSAMFAS